MTKILSTATITFDEVQGDDGELGIDVRIKYGDNNRPTYESTAHKSAAHVFNHISDLLTPRINPEQNT